MNFYFCLIHLEWFADFFNFDLFDLYDLSLLGIFYSGDKEETDFAFSIFFIKFRVNNLKFLAEKEISITTWFKEFTWVIKND